MPLDAGTLGYNLTHLDFQSGKLERVARHLSPHRQREYRLLGLVLVGTSLPVLLLLCFQPIAGCLLVLFAAYFQVLATFATSTTTQTSHHIRFLLAGSNPLGMIGASSLILGAVDAIIDWQEDRGTRRRQPLRYWPLVLYKFAMTPVGVVLMVLEYAWDAVLLRRPAIVAHKWHELFSLAWYHSFICPEKSNDIFYADLAFARFQQDPYRYQWNRMRALVFELEHYRIDFEAGLGVSATNIFWQDELTAYQSLKRLQVEAIEQEIANGFAASPTMLPVPPSLGKRLVDNARPLDHYLRMRAQLECPPAPAWLDRLQQVCGLPAKEFSVWHVFRILDAAPCPIGPHLSRYVSDQQLAAMARRGILEPSEGSAEVYRLTSNFRVALEKLLADAFERVPAARDHSLHVLPTQLTWEQHTYVPRG